MSSKYIDMTAVTQVIGCIFNNPKLLEQTDKYIITESDFTDTFHKVIFGTIYNLFNNGSENITMNNILDYLESRPKSKAIFDKQKGEEWLNKVSDAATPEAFDYYYNRMKKFTLLRAYEAYGIDVKDIYDPDGLLDIKQIQLQEDRLDNSSLEDIANGIEKKIEDIRYEYVNDSDGKAYQAGEGVFDLIKDLQKHPELGFPLFGPYINTVTRGARLKKFYLRSAATGVGNIRTKIKNK